jgi:2-keto-3-deoxy-L-rhamnonate aldolase RhmA
MNALLNAAWSKNRVLLGTWIKIPSVFILESTIKAGFDFLVIEMEHSYLSEEFLFTATVIAQAHNVPLIVRTAESSGKGLSRILDIGIDGVLFPQLANAEQAKQALDATRFQPVGTRGVGVTSRAGEWASISQEQYMAKNDENLFRCVQFELESAFDDLDNILDLPGLSATFLGPSDLSQALGVPMNDPKIYELGRLLVEKSKVKGLPCGTAVGNPTLIEKAIEVGYNFIMVSNDTSIYNNAARNLVQESAAARAKWQG